MFAPGACKDPEIVVREVRTEKHGAYYYVINTSMHPKAGAAVTPKIEGATEHGIRNAEIGYAREMLAATPSSWPSH